MSMLLLVYLLATLEPIQASMVQHLPRCSSESQQRWDNHIAHGITVPVKPSRERFSLLQGLYVISARTFEPDWLQQKIKQTGLEIFISHVTSHKLVACLNFPNIRGRPMAIKIFNATMWYALLTFDDTEEDRFSSGRLVIINITPNRVSARVAAHLPGATHDLLLQPIPQRGLVLTWLQHRLISYREMRDCDVHKMFQACKMHQYFA